MARGGLCGRGYGLGQRVSGKGFAGKGAEAPHPEFSGYDWVPVNHGHGPFGADMGHSGRAGLTRQSSALPTAATSRPPARPRSGAPAAVATGSPATATPRGPRRCRPRSWSALLPAPGRSLRERRAWVGGQTTPPPRRPPSFAPARSPGWRRLGAGSGVGDQPRGNAFPQGPWAWSLVLQTSLFWAFLR